MNPVRWVGYTTRYREGGVQMRRAAELIVSALAVMPWLALACWVRL